MTFREISVKYMYDSDEDDILNEFYIPVLSKTVKYQRRTGSFSSSALALAARGIVGLLENDGHMQIVAGSLTNYRDVIAIMEAKDPASQIAKLMIEDLNNIEDEIIKDHVAALGWLVAQNKLEIKIAIPLLKGEIVDSRLEQQFGLFHQKVGILEDSEGNIITFSGSANESKFAWLFNVEELKVHRSWIPAEKMYAEGDLKMFNKYWNHKAKRTRVIDVPQAVKERLIEMSPKSAEVVKRRLNKWYKLLRQKIVKAKLPYTPEKSSGWKFDLNQGIPMIELERDKLRKCQEDALDYLENEKYLGILSMATGSGKTRAAIYAAYDLVLKQYQSNRPLLILVSVPDLFLVGQWKEKVSRYSKNIFQISSENPQWKRDINDIFIVLKGTKTHYFLIGTNLSMNSEFFKKISAKVKYEDILFIGDEMHSLGAHLSRYGLSTFNPKYRIGLSATPVRKYDEEGTEFLMDWFDIKNGKEQFNFDLKDGQREGYLVEYEYYPRFCLIDESSFLYFKKLTDEINRYSAFSKTSEEVSEALTLKILNRARILKKTPSKIKILNKIITDLHSKNRLWNTVVYAEDKDQVSKIKSLISDLRTKKRMDIKFAVFDGSSDRDKRDMIIEKSNQKEIHLILAMRCLDQGVDIPSLEKSIFLSSASTPLQHIQRTGRLLRKSKGKNFAEIYDVLVCPTDDHIRKHQYICEVIKRIEKTRARFFADSAINTFEALTEINKKYP